MLCRFISPVYTVQFSFIDISTKIFINIKRRLLLYSSDLHICQQVNSMNSKWTCSTVTSPPCQPQLNSESDVCTSLFFSCAPSSEFVVVSAAFPYERSSVIKFVHKIADCFVPFKDLFLILRFGYSSKIFFCMLACDNTTGLSVSGVSSDDTLQTDD